MPDLAGTIPGWITAGSALSMLGLWLRYLTTRRQQDGVRLTDLEAENRKLRKDLDDNREKFRKDLDDNREKCAKETAGLRELIEGLRAQMLQLQLRGIAGAMDVPPATRDAFMDLIEKLSEKD